MGSSRWSEESYSSRASLRSASGVEGVSTPYTKEVESGRAEHKTHDKLNPHGVAFRESRDSAEHPNSIPIIVAFDVTGSMRGIPPVLQKKLGGLMQLLIKKGYVEDPQIMFSAVGDATCDRAPSQIGQFESGVEMDHDLDNILLEGGGGHSDNESYELAAYFFARHTVTDAWEKRGKKGYLFFIADERPYDSVGKELVHRVYGDTIQTSIPTEQIFAELQEKWEVFCLYPMTGSAYSNSKAQRQAWVDLLGQRVIGLDKADNVAETIAMTIGLSEGRVDLGGGESDLVDMGTSATVAKSVSTSLAPYAATALSKASATGAIAEIGEGDLVGAGSSSAKRL